MVKALQSANRLLPAARQKGSEMTGSQEAVPVDAPENLPVAIGQPEPGNLRRSFETGEASECHRLIVTWHNASYVMAGAMVVLRFPPF